MATILSVYNRLQAGDYENGNGGKRRVSRLTQFIHATLQLTNMTEKRLFQDDQTWGIFTFHHASDPISGETQAAKMFVTHFICSYILD